jgi:hypothetical protein
VFRKGGVARIARGPVALYARFVILDSGEKPELLQKCLMLINTILIQRTIERQELWAQLKPEDFRALTPLILWPYQSVRSIRIGFGRRLIPGSRLTVTYGGLSQRPCRSPFQGQQ